MTQEEKRLLLIDLCARLPYGVKVRNAEMGFDIYDFNHNVKEIKTLIEEYSISPYLRPMSSMTDKEKSVWYSFMETYQGFPDDTIHFNKINDYQDWLNAYHFDYRGLIEKGLALEAPEGMYKTE